MGNVTKEQARAFWRDLMGQLYGDPDYKGSSASMQPKWFAEYMGITEDEAEAFLWRCSREDLRLTERQGGGYVV